MKRLFSIALILILASPSIKAQQTLIGPAWKGRDLTLSGHVIGYKPGHDPMVGCLLVQADTRIRQPQGRTWACSPQVNATMVRWTIEGQRVHIRGRVATLQKTRIGPQWRFVPRVENASVRVR